jgi:hypothetical protein
VNVEEGAWVLVSDNVVSGGVNLKGMQGKVVYAWEKCEVDPTCCCAELSMEDASVQVPFLYVFLNVFLWCSLVFLYDAYKCSGALNPKP